MVVHCIQYPMVDAVMRSVRVFKYTCTMIISQCSCYCRDPHGLVIPYKLGFVGNWSLGRHIFMVEVLSYDFTEISWWQYS